MKLGHESGVDLPVNSIKQWGSSLVRIMDDMGRIPSLWDRDLARYQKYCLSIPDLLDSGSIRLAVVGAIKSGKSTFINSLLKKEVVKRGAGVRTSITTRIVKGRKNQALLTFASWDEINSQLVKSLETFPPDILNLPHDMDLTRFDLRRERDREFLARARDAIVREFPVTDQGFSPEAVAIFHALDGYESCKDFVQPEPCSLSFDSRQMMKHMDFTSDPDKAFYLTRARLQVYAPAMLSHVEIADCQGADSTDPAQMEEILGYMESASLMVYCISSRHGLRRADISFLSIIRELGLLENTLFCINCDLSEHENIMDLETLVQKACRDLQCFVSRPRVFAFSFLYDLFGHLGGKLSARDRLLHDLWEKDTALADLCRKNSREFHDYLNQSLEQHRSRLLVSSHVQRMKRIARDMEKKMGLALDMLTADQAGQEALRQKFLGKRKRAEHMNTMIQASVTAAALEQKKKMEMEIQAFFFQGRHSIFQEMKSLITRTDIFSPSSDDNVESAPVTRIPYAMFQKLKARLDEYTAQKILPKIKVAIAGNQQELSRWRSVVMESFDPGHTDEHTGEKNPGQDILSQDFQMHSMETILGLSVPSPVFSYTCKRQMQIRVFGGMGFQGFRGLFHILLGRYKKLAARSWLKRAEHEVKHQCLRQIHHQLNAYAQTLWSRYYVPLIAGMARDMTETIAHGLEEYVAASHRLDDIMALEEKGKTQQIQQIHGCQQALGKLFQSFDPDVPKN